MSRRFQASSIAAALLLAMNSVSFGAGSIQPPVTVGLQNGPLSQGTVGSATFPITVTRDHNGELNMTFTVMYTGPAPQGVTFNAPPVSASGNDSPIPATATFTTTNNSSAGYFTFQITASDGKNMVTSDPQFLLIGPQSTPEIDPGAATGALTVIAGLYLMFKDRRTRRRA
jgi:hypothetical protein